MTELLATSEDGTTIAALDEGAGPTLLVVHPGGGDASAWDRVAALLTDEFRVVRIQRRIYAPSADPSSTPGRHSMAVEAADILAVAALLDGPLLLVGHSSGAVAALETALRVPSLFAGLFVYEPPMPTRALVAGEAGRRARAALDAGDPAEAMRIHMRDVVGMSAVMADADFGEAADHAAFAATVAAQLTDNDSIDGLGVGVDRYAELSLPTVLFEGDQTPAHLHDRAADLAAVLPNAQIVTLTGHGHVAHFSAPAALAEAIKAMAGRVL